MTTGLLTINEAREAIGMDPVEWGDVWWMPMSLTSSEQAMEPPEPGEAQEPAEV